MKVAGNGQAAILSSEQLDLLFKEGFTSSQDKALFGICFYTACRISEALQLRIEDVGRESIVFRKGNTKGKLKTREVAIVYPLRVLLSNYDPGNKVRLFPNLWAKQDFLSRHTADKRFRLACERVGIEGASTHSFRRTALTRMSSANVPLRVIQKISGHSELGTLQLYLEVTDTQTLAAVQSICY